MTHRVTQRGITAGAATAVAAAALTLLSTGAAHAAPDSVTWTDRIATVTRTVSDAAPKAGDTITVTTKFERSTSPDLQLNWVKDFHDACLTYVMDSAKVDDGTGARGVEPYLEIRPGFIAGDFMSTSYRVFVKPAGPVTFTAKYTVGASCNRGTPLSSGSSYQTSLGQGDYNSYGPFVTVAKDSDGGGVSTGSLGSLLGTGSSK
ncbi:hypothetical protein ACFXO9_09500 [Nocardia tengchongensis]|uniref:hypothetical protein n=1 Tax=Nocardia tengchongensis TaxID=2055889 RepID=UPI003675EE4B